MKHAPVKKPTCRILVIGSQHARVAKVMSMLHQQREQEQILSISNKEDTVADQSSHSNDNNHQSHVNVEYLPCVATFGSYQDETTNKRIRYLVSIDYYEYSSKDGSIAQQVQSLLPFFDENASSQKTNSHDKKSSLTNIDNNINNPAAKGSSLRFPSIAGAAIGCGVYDNEDVTKIKSFLETIMSSTASATNDVNDAIDNSIVIDVIKPDTSLYNSMQEEMQAYKLLSDIEKQKVTKDQSLGPAKMVKFIRDFTESIIHEAILRQQKKLVESEQINSNNQQMTSTLSQFDDGKKDVNSIIATNEKAPDLVPVHDVDPDAIRYTCRKCRTILFGEADLQNPPHVPSKHKFAVRKNSGSAYAPCQSYFLANTLSWIMGTSQNDGIEGKFSCYHCHTKTGHWNWSGAQCSCGTWVVPALQIPKSKVDVLLPTATTISSLLTTTITTTHTNQPTTSSANTDTNTVYSNSINGNIGTNDSMQVNNTFTSAVVMPKFMTVMPKIQ